MLGKPRSEDSVSWAAFLPIPLLTAPGPLWHALRRASRLRHLDPQDEPVIRIPRPVRADHPGPDVLSHPVSGAFEQRSKPLAAHARFTPTGRRPGTARPCRRGGRCGVVAPVLGLDLLQLRRRRPPPALRCRPCSRRSATAPARYWSCAGSTAGTGTCPAAGSRWARRRAGGDPRGRQGVRGAHRPRRAIRRPVFIGSQPRKRPE